MLTARGMSRWDDVTVSYEYRVTFSETDGLGFVHHANAAVWFERGRELYFRRFGVPASELYRRGWYLALRHLNVRYDNFVGYDDELTVRCALTKLGRVACDFHYRVDNRTTGKLAIRGHTNMVAVEAEVVGQLPKLGRIRWDRQPFEARLVDVDEFFDASAGAWRATRWEADEPEPVKPAP